MPPEPVTSTSTTTVNLNIGVVAPTSQPVRRGNPLHGRQYDRRRGHLHQRQRKRGIHWRGRGRDRDLHRIGQLRVGESIAILIGRGGGRIVFGPSAFSSTNQDSQIRGDSTGVIEFSSAAAANNRVSIYDTASWQTDVNALPTRVTFQPPSGGTWLVRNTAQTVPNNGSVDVNAAATIDTAVDLDLAGALQGLGASPRPVRARSRSVRTVATAVR